MIRNAHLKSALLVASALFASFPAQAIDLPVQGSGRGGPFRVACPGGSFMTGFEGRTGGWIDSFRIVCASFDANARQLTNPLSVAKTIGVSGGGGPSSASCPSGWGISGIKYQETKGDGPSNVGHSIGFTCAATVGPEIVARHFGPLSTPEARSRPGTVLGTNFGSPPLEPSQCPGGEFAIGLHGQSGKFVDAVGLICVPLPAATAQSAQPAQPSGLGRRAMERAQDRQDRRTQGRLEKEAAAATPQVPNPEGFTGTWQTKTDKGWSYVITFLQDGREVSGTYVAQNNDKGRIKGRFGANVMQFTWEQDGGFTGTGQFSLASDGNSFSGIYKAEPHPKLTDPAFLQGSWNGTRK